jgi:hypothetical protein
MPFSIVFFIQLPFHRYFERVFILVSVYILRFYFYILLWTFICIFFLFCTEDGCVEVSIEIFASLFLLFHWLSLSSFLSSLRFFVLQIPWLWFCSVILCFWHISLGKLLNLFLVVLFFHSLYNYPVWSFPISPIIKTRTKVRVLQRTFLQIET